MGATSNVLLIIVRETATRVGMTSSNDTVTWTKTRGLRPPAQIAIFLPPVSVFLQTGCSCDLLINVCLTILAFIPGHVSDQTLHAALIADADQMLQIHAFW